jgi:single-stranded-DNA-specific exonuclease
MTFIGLYQSNNHLKMTVKQEHSPSFDCIGFGLSEHIETINSGKPFDMCYSIEENVWRGKKNLQLNLKGIRY